MNEWLFNHLPAFYPVFLQEYLDIAGEKTNIKQKTLKQNFIASGFECRKLLFTARTNRVLIPGMAFFIPLFPV